MIDNISQFLNSIREFGLQPYNHIEPGKIYRVPGIGKKRGNTAGWYQLFHDGLGGCYGDWSIGQSGSWHIKNNSPLSPAERNNFNDHINEAKRQAKLQLKHKQSAAAKKACSIWYMSRSANNHHPYLIQKGINSRNSRLYKQSLVLSIMSFSGKISSLQFIEPNGKKILLSGGRKKGCFIPVTSFTDDFTKVIICEGWSTGCTLAELEPKAHVLAAIDAGNLQSVAIAARKQWPNTELIIAGDDDRLTVTNVGATKARSAAIASGALLMLPQWPEGSPDNLTDFNDLVTWLTRGEI